MTALATVCLADRRASAFIRRGQRAWNEIKKTAEEQRTLWLEVGVALMYGKQKENRAPGQRFSEWVQQSFPGLDTNDYAPAAIWYAMDFPKDSENLIPTGMSDPVCIRRWFNSRQATQALPEDLRDAPVASTPTLAPREAQKVNKLAHRAESGDEGSETAARMLKAFAKAHGVDLEAILKAAGEGDPDGRHRFPPARQAAIDNWRSGIRSDVSEMERQGIPRQAIKDLLIHLANSL